jgi:hypothetical protein
MKWRNAWFFVLGMHFGGLVFIWAIESGYQHYAGTIGKKCFPGDTCRSGLQCIKVERSLSTWWEDSRCVAR